jgi:ketosteroid isomerase-like protein
MSQENVEPTRAVRIPLVPETRRHRSLEERIIVRFPAIARQVSAAWARLPRNSRLRRAILVHRVRQGFAALDRRDFDVLVTGLDPGVELHMGHVLPDVGPVFHGHDGYRELWRHLLEAADTRFKPEELLDLGDRVLVTAQLTAQGAGSGVLVSQPLFQLFTLRRGLVVREHDFQDRGEALQAAGLAE